MDIKVDHISKAYGEQQVLQDLSCVFPEGKTTCIRGRSGCGKTTLIRLDVYKRQVPIYMDEFVGACFIPHTDTSMFPTVMEEIQNR